jgi:hypothetical protein
MTLIRNRIRCLACDDIIESKTVHDFRMCQCGQTFVDGGLEYERRGYGEYGYEDLSEREPEPKRPWWRTLR